MISTFEKMKSTAVAARMRLGVVGGPVVIRMMGTRLPTRAAVHGTKDPVTRAINIEEVEAEIEKGKEKKEKKTEEVEDSIDSQLNHHTPPSSSSSTSSPGSTASS